MAFGTTGAGTITKEQTLLSIRRISVAGTTTITKGEVCEINSAGDLITAIAESTRTREIPHYVALETVDNSGGSASDLFCPVAVPGHYVTVIADGVIEPGERVIIAGTAGQVVAYTSSDEYDEVVGTYFGKEGGSIAKSASTPYAETFTDSADFNPVPCANDDVIEILLGVA